MKTLSLAAVVLFTVAASLINQIKFIPASSTVKFQVFVESKKPSNEIVPLVNQKKDVEADGVINGLTGGVVLDSANNMPSSINASVAVATINSGVEMRDESLRSADFFDVKKYPFIEFVSSSVKENNQKYMAEGTLKIKNVAKKITIPFIVIVKADTVFYKGNFSINRYDYNVGTKDDGIGKEVAIEFNLPIVKK